MYTVYIYPSCVSIHQFPLRIGSMSAAYTVCSIALESSIMKPSIRTVGPVPCKNMQNPPFSFASIFLKDAHSAESNEISIFRYLIFDYGWGFLWKLFFFGVT